MDIKVLSWDIRSKVWTDVIELRKQWITPRLSVILVWWDESAIIYAQTKRLLFNYE